MIGKKRNVVMVEKDIYEAMTEAFRKVKAERDRNRELADKLKKDLKLLDFELTRIGAKISELLISVNTLEESIRHLSEYSIDYSMSSIRDKLSKKMEHTMYTIDGMENKIHRLREIMDIIKRDIKPWEESYEQRIFEE